MENKTNAKVLRARLMNQPEDFKRLGINPEKVETWEDGRRTRTEEVGSEVWYFDGTMDDGTKFMVGYRPKSMNGMTKTVDSPHVNIYIKSPDGKEFRDDIVYPANEGSFSREQCDTKVGPHWCRGDFKHYDLHFEPVHGVGLDLHYDALTEPFRQGTSLLAFGDNDEFYHTDLAVPKNQVSGRLFYDGEWHEVNGLGYHDHQWMNTMHFTLYHHWFWGRMYTDLYTIYIYDFVAARQYGYKQLPMFGLMDNKTGKVVFMTDGHFDLKTRLEPEAHKGREFPKESHYVFTNADGSRAEFDVEWEDQLEFWDMYEMAGEELKRRYDALGMRMQYCRYYAKGGVRFTPAGGETREAKGDMIYEYAYMGHARPRRTCLTNKREQSRKQTKFKGRPRASLVLDNGIELTYCERGQQNEEVMLFGGFFFTFMPIVEKLAERYHVYGIVMRFRIFAANCVTAVCGFCCNFAPEFKTTFV